MERRFNAIVLNWNESHISVDTVKLLLEENIDVILVDNGSDDESDIKFREFGDKIKYIRLNCNYGSSLGRNAGINFIEHEYTFLIDGDILYVPGTIESYSMILDKYQDAGCVGYFNNGGYGTKERDKSDKHINEIKEIGEWYPQAWTQYGLFRSQVLKQYGFVDSHPFNQAGYGYEDNWLYRKMVINNWKSLHVNAPYYYHDAHFSIREMAKRGLSIKNHERMYEYRIKCGNDDVRDRIKTYYPYIDKKDVDVIMLSFTNSIEIYNMTSKAIETLIESEPNIHFRIYLIETNPDFTSMFPKGYQANVIIPNLPFNYNQYVNIGLSKCTSDYIVITNNDVLFNPNWFTILEEEMNKYGAKSSSPYWEKWFMSRKLSVPDVWEGHEVGKQVFGYCIVVKKEALDIIGKFDERFTFYFQDDDYAMQIKKHNIKHILVKKSIVHHIESVSHGLLKDKDYHTNGMKQIFESKWGIAQ